MRRRCARALVAFAVAVTVAGCRDDGSAATGSAPVHTTRVATSSAPALSPSVVVAPSAATAAATIPATTRVTPAPAPSLTQVPLPPVKAAGPPPAVLAEQTVALDATLISSTEGLVLLESCRGVACVYRIDASHDGGRTWHQSVVITGDQRGRPAEGGGILSEVSAIDSRHFLVTGLQTWLTSDGGLHWKRIWLTTWGTMVARDHDWLDLGAPRPDDPPLTVDELRAGECTFGVDRLTETGRLQPLTTERYCGSYPPASSGDAVWTAAIRGRGDPVGLVSGDDGQHWRQTLLPRPCYVPSVAYEKGSTTLYGVCEVSADPSTPELVFRSTDRGRHWTKLGLGPSLGVYERLLVPSAHLMWRWAAGHGVYRSVDGGKHWSVVQADRSRAAKTPLLQAFSASGRTAWVIAPPVAGAYPVVHVTRDGGDTWSASTLPAAPVSTVVSAAVLGSRHVAVLARSCTAQVWSWSVELSRDDGASWRQSPAIATSRAEGPHCGDPISEPVDRLLAVDLQHLYAYGHQGVWFSATGGLSWQKSAVSGEVLRAAAVPAGLWALTDAGRLALVGLSGGVETRALPRRAGHPVELAAIGSDIVVATPETVWTVDLWRSTDLGRSWRATAPLPCPPTYAPNELESAAGAMWWSCLGGAWTGSVPKALYRSADAGAHWMRAGPLEVRGGALTLAGTGSILWRYGASLFRSTDGGRRWVPVLRDVVDGQLAEIATFAAGAERAWMFWTPLGASRQSALKTRDGGSNWQPIQIP